MGKGEGSRELTGLEQEVEESSTLLLRKKSTSGNESKSVDMDSVDVEVGNGQANLSLVDKYEESAALGMEDTIKEFGGSLENESEVKSEKNLVFYQKDEGIWKCRICTWTYRNGSACVDHIQNNKGQFHKLMNVKSLNFEIKGVESSSTYSGGKQIENSSTFQPSEISHEAFASYGSSKEIESVEVDLTNGDELEVTEIDVEKVLQKQNTHDLYCPNCNSCITKRVILRKRKRRIRNKLEAAVRPNLVIGSVQTSSDQIDGVGFGDNTELPTSDENEHDREPDVFRCLSCFSFFIPNGNGFKLFRIFGEKSVKENIGDEQVTGTRKNWFTSLFASNKQETSVGQGNNLQIDAGESDVRVPLFSKLGDQTGEPSSGKKAQFLAHTSAVVGTVQNNGAESRDGILPFPKQESAVNGKAVIGLGDKSNEATTEKNQIDATMGQFEAYTSEQLEEFKSCKDLQLSHEDNLSVEAPPKRTQVTNGESADKEFSFSQGGLKLLIYSNKGNVIPDKSDEDTEGELSISVAVPHKEQEVGSHILTDSSAESKFFTSTEAGKDTIITIDARPAKSSQALQGINVVPTESTSEFLSGVPTVTGDGGRREVRKELEIEVVKSIIYGGLAVSITSLSVVSSAAGGGAGTLNILALGMANLIGGLFIICQNLWELRNDRAEQVSDQVSDQVHKQRDRYKELLGRRENFILHATLVLISYFIFGLLSPVVYGFSFRKSDDKELKLLVVSAASLLCIVMLAIARAHVQTSPKPYLKTVLTFVILGFMVSGVSYASGVLIERLLVKLHVFRPSSGSNLVMPEMMKSVDYSAWMSY